jgi:hypothetical protein
VIHPVAKPDAPQRVFRKAAAFGVSYAAVYKWEFHIFERTLTPYKVEILEDEPDFPVPDMREAFFTKRRNVVPVKAVAAACRCVEAAYYIHHCRFSGA